jgi:prepilin-type N-terminal cleavage/methylation domain-containing protein
MILRKKNNKRGFTLAESVLALAIISIATVGTLTLITSGQKSTQLALDKQQAQFYAADILSCARTENFEENIKFAFGLKSFTKGDSIPLSGGMTASFDGRTVTIYKGDKKLTSLSMIGGTP